MIQSMTGYGKAEALLDTGKLTVEIRTLNGKSADISIKSSLLPKDKELYVRQLIADKLIRGTIDVYLGFEPTAGSNRPVDEELAAACYEQLRALREKVGGFAMGSTEAADRMNNELLCAVLRLPDVVNVRKGDAVTPENWPLVEQAFREALEAVTAYRSKEGEALHRDVLSRIRNIEARYDEVERMEPERVAAVRERLKKNLEELAQKVDPSRFEQEMVFYLEKLDINEERVRLRQHCRYFLDTLETEPCPGKKLGFIIQEMGREINTTGSKANHVGIQQAVVKMKDELEKLREQSLNIL